MCDGMEALGLVRDQSRESVITTPGQQGPMGGSLTPGGKVSQTARSAENKVDGESGKICRGGKNNNYICPLYARSVVCAYRHIIAVRYSGNSLQETL